MHTLLLALHVLFAVFGVGPLVGAAAAAPRAMRADGDTAGTARAVRIYTFASVLVVGLGIGVMSTGTHRPSFADTWIWLSLVLWLVAAVAALGLLVPALTAGRAARVGLSAAAIGLCYTVIVFLMVYRP